MTLRHGTLALAWGRDGHRSVIAALRWRRVILAGHTSWFLPSIGVINYMTAGPGLSSSSENQMVAALTGTYLPNQRNKAKPFFRVNTSNSNVFHCNP